MSVKLYVGNLPFETAEEDIKSIFEEAGSVLSCELIRDKFSNRSRGFAFVEMESREGADNAIQLLNGKEFSGRTLVVNEARPKTERRSGGERPGRGRSDFRRPSSPGGGGGGGRHRPRENRRRGDTF
ncbi:MAG: RNA-binding protein [Lentisphaerae bacterium]|nr:RNA-binding protein [Lentisphaerota bacterium]